MARPGEGGHVGEGELDAVAPGHGQDHLRFEGPFDVNVEFRLRGKVDLVERRFQPRLGTAAVSVWGVVVSDALPSTMTPRRGGRRPSSWRSRWGRWLIGVLGRVGGGKVGVVEKSRRVGASFDPFEPGNIG